MSPKDVTTIQAGTTSNDTALRAYSLWEQRGSPLGSPDEDWFRAEQEIRSEKAPSAETGKNLKAKAKSASA
jgi:hypothetical protein